ncbi:glycoside hydrolase family 88 protein [Bacillus sp. FJAT-50079]|uniref:glycoside hydrolase family 88 protein n=1 Tax=Bacillus sp. FJAT-50079 TaxID=2833577 RepID=UPI001BCA1141|nr:glycoside hydrolase family 88 protein [Bacillus sp. FJAT-50079]MBS4210837.1 glycoside hydrolase family 88 protein [Bacillus sp. FJAT-50079]
MKQSLVDNTIEHDLWVDDVWRRIVTKIERTSKRIGISTPHASVDGVYDQMRPSWWTAGFWPGILWQIVAEEDANELKDLAIKCEEGLDESLYNLSVHHDAGFIWLLTAVAHYKLTGNEQSKHRGLMAASQLASRFNIKGNYIRAWHDGLGFNRSGWSIIDTMMNISLLYWASDITNDPRFKHMAMAHADTVLKEFVREDGSSYHIVCFDAETGRRVGERPGQGYSTESAWTRGSAWTIYGLTNCYLHSKEARYLEGAKKAANFFLENLPEDSVPHWDFFVEKNGETPRDSSAGAIAACGLIELAKVLPDIDRKVYFDAAVRILQSLDKNYGAWNDPNEEGLIKKGTSNVNDDTHVNRPLIYGDYFFVEGIAKLKGSKLMVW